MKSNTGTSPSKKKTKAAAPKAAAPVAPTAAKPTPTAVMAAPAAPVVTPSGPPPAAPKAPVAQPPAAAVAATAKTPVAPAKTPAPTAAAPFAPKSPAPARIVETPKPTTAPETVKVSFTFFDPVATRVTLAGEFNAWSPETHALKRQGEGLWQATVSLKPGKYQYKFIVDGSWVHDPKASEIRANEFGTLNSVVEVRL